MYVYYDIGIDTSHCTSFSCKMLKIMQRRKLKISSGPRRLKNVCSWIPFKNEVLEEKSLVSFNTSLITLQPTRPNIVTSVFVSAVTFLQSRCLAAIWVNICRRKI
jgi:hypothetical protein